MPARAAVELVGLEIDLRPGPNGGDAPRGAGEGPERNLLDMTLRLDPSLVLVPEDAMERVFDYDPVVAELRRIAAAEVYVTHERMLTLMAEALAADPRIEAAELFLRKRLDPGRAGDLGVRLSLDAEALARLRG